MFVRAGALAAAVAVGLLFIGAVTSWPSRGRERRGTWALGHVSRWVLAAMSVRTVVHGAPRSGPSLVVGNHRCWLDSLVLASCAPMRLVARAEIGEVPVLGAVAGRAGALFLRSSRPMDLADGVAAMTTALRSGSRVQVFPEGPNPCGGTIEPFHRALFQSAIDAAVVISPVTISYRQGLEPTRAAFVGGDSLTESLRRMLSARNLSVEVIWLRPIPALAATGDDRTDRARIALLTENAVSRNLGLVVGCQRPDCGG